MLSTPLSWWSLWRKNSSCGKEDRAVNPVEERAKSTSRCFRFFMFNAILHAKWSCQELTLKSHAFICSLKWVTRVHSSMTLDHESRSMYSIGLIFSESQKILTNTHKKTRLLLSLLSHETLSLNKKQRIPIKTWTHSLAVKVNDSCDLFSSRWVSIFFILAK